MRVLFVPLRHLRNDFTLLKSKSSLLFFFYIKRCTLYCVCALRIRVVVAWRVSLLTMGLTLPAALVSKTNLSVGRGATWESETA